MTGSLIGSKLTPPPIRELVVRPRLGETLARVLNRRLALVSAPAGFGKSTLIADWIRASGVAAAWVALDADDNDVARFLAYISEAFRSVVPRAAAAAHHLLESASPIATEPVLTALVNGTRSIVRDFLLVLDDYHLIGEQEVHRSVTFLLDRLPPRVHLVIATRADPPLPLALLRSRDEMVELRASDLRFTASESEDFFNSLTGLHLSIEEVRTLAERTEGWIAGMRLAASSLRASRDPSDYIRKFSGSDRYVLDYLSEEVLRRLPATTQSFLVRTSILDMLCGPLCETLTGVADSASILREMETAGLFLEPLEEGRTWYRYHPLFADLLRNRLSQLAPQEVVDLHRRACSWYGKKGMTEAAISHALAARDFPSAAGLVLSLAEDLMMHCQAATLLRWIDALPPEVRGQPALLSVWRISAMLLVGKSRSSVEEALREAEAGDNATAVRAELAAVKSFKAYLQEKPRESLSYAREALAGLPEGNRFLRHTVREIVGVLSLSVGDTETAQRNLEATVREARRAENHFLLALAHQRLALLAMMRGRLREAERLCLEAIAASADEKGDRFPVVAEPIGLLSEIHLEQNDLARAETRLKEAFATAEEWTARSSLECHRLGMRLHAARGDLDGALAECRTARELAAHNDLSEIDDRLGEAQYASICLEFGQIDEAERWAENRGLDHELARLRKKGTAPRSYLIVHAEEYFVFTRLQLAIGRAREALDLARFLEAEAEAKGLRRNTLRLRVVACLALERLGQIEEGMETLGGALAIGEPEGFVRVFVAGGLPIARLLAEVARHGAHAGYAGRLLGAFPVKAAPGGVAADGAYRAAAAASVVEPLSAREVEMVRLLAEGLSNKEIAERAFVALQTVKWHTSNVYAKLGVKSRTQAVARARSLGIIPPA